MSRQSACLITALAGCLLSACTNAADDAAADALTGAEWRITEIAGQSVLESSTATLRFDSDGRAGGRGPCNTYGAGYQISGARITFEAPFSTTMACDPALMEQERALFDLLSQIRSFGIGDDGVLVLTAEDGRTIIGHR
ncbi:heat shock protein HslJ [Dongia mobilis]|uniref:Heat shock protein HslJ n=1 Tax=Dongia mobilis TaxID=578943 RepID=A0A4R6WQI1_9PROT|nr:META domain-containing protein [Dongia mobilis]TDQ78792.1 heat shock protein HslJ [Dongia mobilis]